MKVEGRYIIKNKKIKNFQKKYMFFKPEKIRKEWKK